MVKYSLFVLAIVPLVLEVKTLANERVFLATATQQVDQMLTAIVALVWRYLGPVHVILGQRAHWNETTRSDQA